MKVMVPPFSRAVEPMPAALRPPVTVSLPNLTGTADGTTATTGEAIIRKTSLYLKIADGKDNVLYTSDGNGAGIHCGEAPCASACPPCLRALAGRLRQQPETSPATLRRRGERGRPRPLAAQAGEPDL